MPPICEHVHPLLSAHGFTKPSFEGRKRGRGRGHVRGGRGGIFGETLGQLLAFGGRKMIDNCLGLEKTFRMDTACLVKWSILRSNSRKGNRNSKTLILIFQKR